MKGNLTQCLGHQLLPTRWHWYPRDGHTPLSPMPALGQCQPQPQLQGHKATQWHRIWNKGASAQTGSTEERPVSTTNTVVSLLILLFVKLPGLSLLLLASDLPGFWSFLLANQGKWGESGDNLEEGHSHQLQLTKKPTLLKKSLRFWMTIWGGHYRWRQVHHRHILVARCLVYWEINK